MTDLATTSDRPRLRLGTRRSRLAMWQADFVAARLRACGAEVEIVPIRSLGDDVRNCPIPDIGAPGVFTRRLQEAILAGEIDLAVHSLKDLPTERVPGLTLAAVPSRGEVGDALIATGGRTLEDLPAGSVLGTGSVRRQTQIRYRYGDRFVLRDIRGNVETRLQRLDARNEYDAIILAVAGLDRLGLAERITERLSLDLLLPAVGQGALAIETRDNDDAVLRAVAALDDAATHLAVLAERAMLAHLDGGCIAPIAAHAHLDAASSTLHLRGRLLTNDGSAMREYQQTAELATSCAVLSTCSAMAVSLGVAVAERLR